MSVPVMSVDEAVEDRRRFFYDSKDENGKLDEGVMNRQGIDSLMGVIAFMLDNNCSNPLRSTAELNWSEDPDGWNTYDFDGHCVAFRVIARNVQGTWEIKEVMTINI